MIPQTKKSVSEVSARALLKCIRCNPDDAVVCIAPKENLKNFSSRDVVLECPNLVYGDFSFNHFTRCDLWKHFPDLWWVDLSYNNLVSESLVGFARVIGKLHLTNNMFNGDGKLSPESVEHLSKSHVMRLKWGSEVPTGDIVEHFPYAAVINDNFIRHRDRQHSSLYDSSGNETLLFSKDGIKDAHTDIEGAVPNGNWSTQLPGVRDINYFRAIQTIPANKPLADYFLLDMVLEDYLEETRLVNKYAVDNSVTGHKRMPTVDIEEVMHLPHKFRNDLAVVLTATIMFPELPVQIVEDALVVLLIHFFDADAIKDIIQLPSFVKAGVVAVIKRVCLKEIQEIHFTRRLRDKPRCSIKEMLHDEYKLVLLRAAARVSSAIKTKDDLNNLNNNSNVHNRTTVLCPTFLDADGFYHLRSFKQYTNKVFDSGESDVDIHSGEGTLLNHKEHDVTDGFNEHFTALEMEILANLPNVPSAMDRPPESEVASSSYSDNISFLSRHATLLLTKSPACPSLVRPQNKLPKQDAYRSMLFMLRLAKMTYGDMEITQVGPDKDGRCKSPSKRRAGGDADGAVSKTGQLKLSATVGGNVLAYGSGIPSGTPADFFWNTEQYDEKRRQDKKFERMEENRVKQTKLMERAAAASAAAVGPEGDTAQGAVGGMGVNLASHISIPHLVGEPMESTSLAMLDGDAVGFPLPYDDSIHSYGEDEGAVSKQLTPKVAAPPPGMVNSADILEGLSRGTTRTTSPTSRSHMPHMGASAGGGASVLEVMVPVPANHHDFTSLPASPEHALVSASTDASPHVNEFEASARAAYVSRTKAGSAGGRTAFPVAKSIQGFSNDYSNSSSFLLASQQTVQCYNQATVHHVNLAATEKRNIDPTDIALWDNLDHPPVEILPSTMVKFEQDSTSLIDTWGHIQGEKDRVMKEVAQQEASRENSFISANIDISRLVAESTSMYAGGESGSDIVAPVVIDVRGAGYVEEVPSDMQLQMQRQLTITDFPPQGCDNSSQDNSTATYESYHRNGKPVKGAESVAEATRRLLAEMGTLRNVRSLNDSKRHDAPLPPGRPGVVSTSRNVEVNPRVKEVEDAEDAVFGHSLTPSVKSASAPSPGTTMRFSWGGPFPNYKQFGEDQSQSQSQVLEADRQVTFLTVGDTGETDDSAHAELLTPPKLAVCSPPGSAPQSVPKPSTEGSLTQARTISVSELKSHVSTSAVHTLQHKMGYDHITVAKDVEMGVQSTAGGAPGGGGTWYPLQKKVHYTMDPKKSEEVLGKQITNISESLMAEMTFAQSVLTNANDKRASTGDGPGSGLDQYLHSAGTNDLKGTISKLQLRPKPEVRVKAPRYKVLMPRSQNGSELSQSASTSRLSQMSGTVKLNKKALAAAADAQGRPLIALPKTTVGRMTRSLSVAAADFAAGCHPGGFVGAKAAGVVFPPISKQHVQNPKLTTSKAVHQQMPVPKPLATSPSSSPPHSLRSSPTHSCNVSVAGSLPLSLPSFRPAPGAVEPDTPPHVPVEGMEINIETLAADGLTPGLPGLSDDLDSLPPDTRYGEGPTEFDMDIGGDSLTGGEGGLTGERQDSRDVTSKVIGSVRTALLSPAVEPPSRQQSMKSLSTDGRTSPNHPNIITDEPKAPVVPLVKSAISPHERPKAEMFVLQGSSTRLAVNEGGPSAHGRVEKTRSLRSTGGSRVTAATATVSASKSRSNTTISARVAAKPMSPSTLSLQSEGTTAVGATELNSPDGLQFLKNNNGEVEIGNLESPGPQ